MRFLIFEFHQETNTFNPVVAGAKDFQPQCIFEGQARFEACVKAGGMVSGMCAAAEQAGHTLIPTLFMHASSGGRVADSVFDHLCQRLQFYIETVGEFDGVLAALHGATATETHHDACGDLLAFLRKLIGDKPIACGFDLHANITDRVLENADIFCGYNSYPHIDHYQTGFRATSLLLDKLAGKPICTAAAEIAMLIPPSGYNDLEGPFRTLMEEGKAMVAKGDILDFTVFPVQAWMDLPAIASRIITHGTDPEKAKGCADKLAADLFALRDDAQTQMLSVDEILDIAEANTTDQPVILAEPADSPNGGCVGDSPIVALALQERKSKLRTCMFIVDAEAAEQAFALGVGGTAEFSVGAKFTPGMPGPFVAQGCVRSLHDGYFRTAKHVVTALGKSAVVRFGEVDILLCSRGGSSGSPMLYRQFGMEPAHYDLVVVKANTSFRRPYSTISSLIYVGDTYGAGAANLKQLHWKNLPTGMYPFDLPDGYTPAPAKLI